MSNDQKHSSYWLGDDILGEDDVVDPYKLAIYQRAITNFVRILTNRNITVTYRGNGVSFTDGKTIVISSDISKDKFDSVVGLALHEAAHIVKSDFGYLAELERNIPDELWDLGDAKLLPRHDIISYTHKMWNWVEDRFIDAFICMIAPGYKGYYESLYARYFNSEKITYHVARRELFTRPKLASYSFRIINAMNPSSDFDALPDLRRIVEIVDLPNILRLRTDKDRLDVALEICKLVFKNIDSLEVIRNKTDAKPDSTATSKNPPKGNEEPEHRDDPDKLVENDDDDEPEPPPESDTEPSEEKEEDEDKIEDDTQEEKEEDEITNEAGNGEGTSNVGEDTDEDANTETPCTQPSDEEMDDLEGDLDKEIKKQETFIVGEVSKKPISKSIKEALKIIEQGCVNIHQIPADNENGLPKFSVVVIKKFNQSVLESPIFQFRTMRGSGMNLKNIEAINEGLRLGTGLGHKLRIRNESNTLTTTRQRSGKIDRRLIHEFGAGETSLFSRITVEKFKKINLHISIDASTSMSGGDKWHKTMTCTAAICKAASMVSNIDVVVSLRGVEYLGKNPCVAIVYDSKKDKIIKIKSLFQYLAPVGATPEGLCFEAIEKLIPSSSQDADSYFLNFSDGEPCYTGYMGDVAYQHTKRQVEKFRQNGIQVLSYYIEMESGSSYIDYHLIMRGAFDIMYGADAFYIDVKNISQVARSLNEKFLKK
jgi:hypothetical protein